MSTGHSVGSLLTDRRYNTFDQSLLLRATSASAITAVDGTFAAPTWASDWINLGNAGNVLSVEIHAFAPTLANADNFIHFCVQGGDAASPTIRTSLADLRIGAADTIWGGSLSATHASYLYSDGLQILFRNVRFGARWPFVRLIVFAGGTSSSFTTGTFGAYINRVV